MGRAEEHHSGALRIELPLEQVEVNGILATVVGKRVAHDPNPVVMGGVAKRIIDRRIENHLVVRLTKRLIKIVNCRNRTIGILDPFRPDFRAVTPCLPAYDRVDELTVRIGVTISTVLREFAQCRPDARGRCKVHIGNPHGNEVVGSIRILASDDAGVPLAAVVKSAIRDVIEVERLMTGISHGATGVVEPRHTITCRS